MQGAIEAIEGEGVLMSFFEEYIPLWIFLLGVGAMLFWIWGQSRRKY
jgi:hypothetical protein